MILQYFGYVWANPTPALPKGEGVIEGFPPLWGGLGWGFSIKNDQVIQSLCLREIKSNKKQRRIHAGN
jgi:hypothetical protein